MAWQPAISFEEMLDAPCKHHSGARPSTHTLQQCAITKCIARGEVVVIEDNFGVRITEIVQTPGIEMLAGGK